jgi:hypothetical protein
MTGRTKPAVTLIDGERRIVVRRFVSSEHTEC